MLKKASLRKIAVTSTALLVLLMLYLFPVSDKSEVSTSVVYITDTNASVYLPDKNGLISVVPVKINEKDIIKNVKKRISYLQNYSGYTKNFKKVIPKNTKLLNIKLDNNILILDFDSKFKESKNINEMITSIVYTVTELKEIKTVKILINNEFLENYDYLLDRSIGINKISDFDSLNNLENTTIYYINKEENNLYYTPVTKITNNSIEKIEVIVTELKSSPILQTNLASYLSSNAELSSYKKEKNVMNLYFNDKTSSLFYSDKVLEEVKYCITKSVLDNYEVEVVNIYFNDKKV